MIFHIFNCGGSPTMEYSGDRMFRVFLEAGRKLQAGLLIHATDNLCPGETELSAGQGSGFIEHDGIDGVH